MSDHLIRKGAIYYYRRRVPADLVAAYKKSEYVKSLKTKDKREAERLQRVVDVEVDTLFQRLRDLPKHAQNTPSDADSTYSTPQIDTVLHNPIRVPPGHADEIDNYERDYQDWLFSGENETPLEQQFLEHDAAEKWKAKQEEKRQQRLADLEEAYERVLAKGGRAVSASPLKSHHTLSTFKIVLPSDGGRRTLTPTDGQSLHAVLRLWANEAKPVPRTVDTAERAANRFRELMGDIPVPAVTKVHIVDFRLKLTQAGHSPNTINKTLSYMSILFNHAVRHAWINSDPAKGTKVSVKKDAGSKRLPFSEDVLNAIFAHPIYSEGLRPERGGGEAAYWLPLMGLFTGARIEELCQLAPADIQQDKYRDSKGNEQTAWVLQITDTGEGQGVKTAGSKRRIPIHAELLTRGFIEYVEAQRSQKRIFPLLKPNKYGEESPNWSVWWMKEMRRSGVIPNDQMVFHSFRHNFKDACRECGIRKEVADALQGHSEGDASGEYGAAFYPLRPMVEAMKKYKVAGVCLPKIVAIV